MFFFSFLKSFISLDICMKECFFIADFIPEYFHNNIFFSGSEKHCELQKVYDNSFIANSEAQFI